MYKPYMSDLKCEGVRSFAFSCHIIWNKISHNIRNAKFSTQLKKLIDEYLEENFAGYNKYPKKSFNTKILCVTALLILLASEDWLVQGFGVLV